MPALGEHGCFAIRKGRNGRLYDVERSEGESVLPSLGCVDVVGLLLEACLPDNTVSMAAHYAQLIAASEAPVVTEAYRKGREALDAAVNRILVRAGVPLKPSVVGALVDGGAVKAISEGYEVRDIVRELLDSAING